jgi:hypothetical protein
MRTSWLPLLLLAGLCATAPAAEPLSQVDVFVSGQDGYHTYRIPAVTTAADGSLVAFAEARKYNALDPGEAGNEIHLVSKRSSDGGRTWSAMKVIENAGPYWSAANPATVVDRQTGRAWVLYIRCKPNRGTDAARPGTDDAQLLARHSDDNGLTWSEPVDLTAVSRDMKDPQWHISVPGPGGMIQDGRGRLIAAAWRYTWGVFAIFSEDHGRTWQRGQAAPGGGESNENQLVELADGRLLMDYRHEGAGPHRWMVESRDGGRSWSQPRPGLPVTAVACAIKRFTLKSAGDDCNRILWSGPKGPGRNNLVVRVSYDEGRTFSTELPIAAGPAAYSDLTILQDKSAGVLWERGDYRYLTFTRMPKQFLAPYPHVSGSICYQVDPHWPQRPAGLPWGEMPGVAVDKEDHVWLFTRAKPSVQIYEAGGRFVRAWDPEIGTAHFIRFDVGGNVWLADVGKHVVTSFTPQGKLLKVLGTRGEPGADGTHLNMPTDVAVAPGGDVFVSDGYGNNRVVHFDKDGKFVNAWGRLGSGPGEFNVPHAIVIDSRGRLYVADRNNARIQVFDRDGKFLDQWCNLLVPWGLWIDKNDEIWACGSSPMPWGETDELLSCPPKDQVLMRFAPSGKLLQLWTFPKGTDGQEKPGDVNWLHGLAFDSQGNLYVTDIIGKRAQKFVRQ